MGVREGIVYWTMISMPAAAHPPDSPPDLPPPSSWSRRLDRLDRRWSRRVARDLPRPRWVRLPLGALSRAANYGILWYGISILPVLFGEARPLMRVLYVAVPVTLVETTGFLIKRRIARPRPPVSDPSLLIQIPLPVSKSFPSSHASMAVVGAITVTVMYPPALPFLAALATLLCFSRVYLGVHYFGDVLAGVAYGLVWGAGWILLVPAP